MKLEEHMEYLRTERQGKSFACLAERVDKTNDAPWGINVAPTSNPEDVTVLFLAGEGNAGADYRGFNGYLKKVDEFVKHHPELQNQNIKVKIAVWDMGKYHNPKTARKLQQEQYKNPEKYKKIISEMPQENREEYLEPSYIKDIFNQEILPRISANNNQNIRVSEVKAKRNIRRLIIMGHCHGGFVALKLEEMMQNKMQQLGYKEKDKIQKQLLIMAYSPDCPLGVSKSQMISFSSAMDFQTNHGSTLKNFLQDYDFGVAFFPKRKGNIFMCTQIDKAGIEGNPPKVYVAIPVEEWYENTIKRKSSKEEDGKEREKNLGEHDFLGFSECQNMSKCSLKMMSYANTILKNALLNSLEQTEGHFKPLPSVRDLATETPKQKKQFIKMLFDSYQWWGMMKIRQNVFRQKFADKFIHVEID